MSKSIFSSSSLGCDVIIDIGAHFGYYSLVAGESNPKAKIISIEASPDNFLVLQRNLKKIQNQHRVQVILGVFGNTLEKRKVHLTDPSDNRGLTGHPNSPTNRQVMVNGINVSSLKIEPNTRVLAKVDVEGHEIEVVEELLRLNESNCELRLLVEFNPQTAIHAGFQPKKLIELILKNNYRIFMIHEDSRDFQEINDVNDSHLKKVGQSYKNIYCLPKRSCNYIAAFLHSNGFGGSEKSHVEVCEDLIASGYMIKTYLPLSSGGIASSIQSAGSSIEDCPSLTKWWTGELSFPLRKSFLNLFLPNSAISWMRERDWSNFDSCLTQTSVTVLGALVALYSDKPHFWWIREFGDLDHRLTYPFDIKTTGVVIRDLSHQVITNSNAVREHFFDGDPEVIVIEPAPKTGNPRNHEKPKVPHISIVANLNPGKGADVFLLALSKLVEDGTRFSASLRGPGGDDREQILRDAIESLGLKSFVNIDRSLQTPEEIYSGTSIVVVASRNEAHGRVAFEATAHNCALVYSRSGGLLEYMSDGVNGLSFYPDDHLELSEKLKTLLKDPAFAETLVLGAKESLLAERRHEKIREKLSRTFYPRQQSPTTSSLQSVIKLELTERDSLVTERDSLVTERDSLVSSLSWKLTMPLRLGWRQVHKLRKRPR